MENEYKGQWYVIQTMSGKENKIKLSVEVTMEKAGVSEYIHEILIPSENVSDVHKGKKRTMNRKFFPGYILVNISLKDDQGELREDLWFFFKNVDGIIGFLGGEKPVPLSKREISNILGQLREEQDVVKPKVQFELGETVTIQEGAFESCEGTIQEIDSDRGKLQLLVSIFGRSTPVEVEYWQIERVRE